MDMELQQRSVEYLTLFRSFDEMRYGVEYPVFHACSIHLINDRIFFLAKGWIIGKDTSYGYKVGDFNRDRKW